MFEVRFDYSVKAYYIVLDKLNKTSFVIDTKSMSYEFNMTKDEYEKMMKKKYNAVSMSIGKKQFLYYKSKKKAKKVMEFLQFTYNLMGR